VTIALLEREAELAALDNAVASAAGGAGSVVLVSGKAGIGRPVWCKRSSR
jgi:predicted ATPase